MEFAVNSAAEIRQLSTEGAVERLRYVADALDLLKTALEGRTALLGFAGSPWTLARYMVEGSSFGKTERAKELFYQEPLLFAELMEKITTVVTEFLLMQIEHGAEAVQIFDSTGDVLADMAGHQAAVDVVAGAGAEADYQRDVAAAIEWMLLSPLGPMS